MADEKKIDKTLNNLACFVHGELAVLHSLGIYYNYRKKNYKSAAFHGIILLFDLTAFRNHLREK